MTDIGVVYIARGKDPNWRRRFERFVDSWLAHPPGVACHLYITYKEFESIVDLNWAIDQFQRLHPVTHIFDFIGHNSWGGGCFQEAIIRYVGEPLVCTLVSTTEIMHDEWLASLWAAYRIPNTTLVGCTGSRVGNIHIRDTAILIRRNVYLDVSRQFDFTVSKDGYLDFEHGPNNLTIQAMNWGERVWVVERYRILAPEAWGSPTTYQGNLENVLVHDRGARDFNDL